MIYGARLRQAREVAKLTQRSVSHEVGINQARWSEAERDSYTLPPQALAEFAQLSGFPEEFFRVPPEVTFRVTPTHFRSRASTSAKDARQAECVGEIVVEAALNMLAELNGPELSVSQPPDPNSPKDAAAYARAALGLAPGEPAVGLTILLEHAGVLVAGLPLPGKGRDAFSLWLGERPVLALLDTDAGDRQMWSAAHEMGHLLMHRGVGASRDLEAQADEFAMHFLTPLAYIRKEIPDNPTLQHFALLKRRWGVSIAALVRTARRLDKVDEHRYISLFKQMSARGERLRERAAILPTKPRGFRAMAETLYGIHPAQQLAKDARWTDAFADEVLSRHATSSELPSRITAIDDSNVVRLRPKPDRSRFA
jgi:Zn-dependent peptidase ImmA (M78 family)/transcriptional regulator with XRE-family HTH domain